jgi:diadenosine tetraphosphatase ApaH/serine/threonine PP2A family protein phosphatase
VSPENGHHLPAPDGSPPRTGGLVCAVGDIHGSLAKLRELVDRCEQFADGAPLTFVFLGDYIDRGPDSAGVVRYLMELQSRRGERLVALKGNHEAVVLDVCDGVCPADLWLSQGGDATLRSYRAARAQDLPETVLNWFRSLPLSYDDGRHFFVHAGVNPQLPLEAQDERDLIWIREPFLSARRDYGRLIVHGHTPLETGEPDFRANRLNLDTGAVFGGPLTAALFADGRTEPVRFIQAG